MEDAKQFVAAALDGIEQMPPEKRISVLKGCAQLCDGIPDPWFAEASRRAVDAAAALSVAESRQLHLLHHTEPAEDAEDE